MTVINHGIWTPYTPDPIPDGAPPSALFFKSESGLDWYSYRSTTWPMDPDTLADMSGTLKIIVVNAVVALAHSDAYALSLGGGCALFEVPGDAGIETKWRYDADSGLFSAPPIPPRIIYKADIWRRASNDEADVMDAMLDSQPARLRRMWADAQYLQSDDELYATIEAALIAQFGATRAEELLA